MPIETLISLAGLAFTVAVSVVGFFVKIGKVESRTESVEKCTEKTSADLEGGLRSVRQDIRDLEKRVVKTESADELHSNKLEHFSAMLEENTHTGRESMRLLTEIRVQMGRVEERMEGSGKTQDQRAGQR